MQDSHDAVAETAVVGFPHPIKGEGINAFARKSYASREVTWFAGKLIWEKRLSANVCGFHRFDVICGLVLLLFQGVWNP